MRLTLHSVDRYAQIELTTAQFLKLRDPSIVINEIKAIALECNVHPDLLFSYVDNLQLSLQDDIEIDGSCDYSDHL